MWIDLAERGLLPDVVVRAGIRRFNALRLRAERQGGPEAVRLRQQRWREEAARAPVALDVASANAQHYEVPAEFYRRVLGPAMKYSGCLWSDGVRDLAGAERAMLDLTFERAGLADGMDVLDLGCGWGSLTLAAARRFPNMRLVGVSNSASQRAFIEDRAREEGLAGRIEVLTRDVNELEPGRRFDRVVSIEMFEHARNHGELLRRIAGWLRDDGRLFVHVFAHRELTYGFGTSRDDDWMGRWFFTGGCMPSEELLPSLADHVRLEDRWRVDGTHYARTAEAWLERLDAERDAVLAILAPTHPPGGAARHLQRWRIFFMACAELFGAASGSEWGVAHYLFARSDRAMAAA